VCVLTFLGALIRLAEMLLLGIHFRQAEGRQVPPPLSQFPGDPL